MSEEFDDWYRRTSAADAERPAVERADAILKFARESAAQCAAERAAPAARADTARQRLRRRRRLTLGAVAAAALAGLVIVPLWMSMPMPPGVERGVSTVKYDAPALPAPVTDSAPAAAAPPPAVAQNLDKVQTPAARAESGAARDQAFGSQSNALEPLAEVAAKAGSARSAAPLAGDAAVAADRLRMAPQSNSRAVSAFDAGVALRAAATLGDVPRLRALLAVPVDLESRDAEGRTALMWAVINRRAEAVELLLAHGADPAAADVRGQSVREAAAAAGDDAVSEALRRASAAGTR